MKTAVIQLNAKADKQHNIKNALSLIRRAIRRQAKFILLPEAYNYRGKIDPRRGYKDISEDIPGPSTGPLIEEAKKQKVVILAGSICERILRSDKVFNTSILIDARGKIIAKYRKIHLFDALIANKTIKESRHLSQGQKAALSGIGPWKAGLSICYDLRFPDLFQKYAKAGADILCVPSAFTKITGQAHWETLLRARAIENLCYVLAPNQIGKDKQGIASYGNSMIIDPWGKILARASGNKKEIIYAVLDRKIINNRRKILPGKK